MTFFARQTTNRAKYENNSIKNPLKLPKLQKIQGEII